MPAPIHCITCGRPIDPGDGYSRWFGEGRSVYTHPACHLPHEEGAPPRNAVTAEEMEAARERRRRLAPLRPARPVLSG